MKNVLPIFVLCSFFSCSDKPRAIVAENAPKAVGPYSHAIASGELLFLSGQIALKSDGSIDTSSIENECRQVMENLKAVLNAAGCTFEDVCKTTIYTTDLRYFSTINEIYKSYLGDMLPARETVEVRALPKGARVEISMISNRNRSQ